MMLRSELYLTGQGQDGLIGTARCMRLCWELKLEKQESLRLAPKNVLFLKDFFFCSPCC